MPPDLLVRRALRDSFRSDTLPSHCRLSTPLNSEAETLGLPWVSSCMSARSSSEQMLDRNALMRVIGALTHESLSPQRQVSVCNLCVQT